MKSPQPFKAISEPLLESAPQLAGSSVETMKFRTYEEVKSLITQIISERFKISASDIANNIAFTKLISDFDSLSALETQLLIEKALRIDIEVRDIQELSCLNELADAVYPIYIESVSK